MTRKEAFEKAREDWNREEETYAKKGFYRSDTPTVQWEAAVDDAHWLARQIKQAMEDLIDELNRDKEALKHYADANSPGISGAMATRDPEYAAELTKILTDVRLTIVDLTIKQTQLTTHGYAISGEADEG